MRFIETVSVITGAGSGIGEATAIRLAKEGSKVILVGRTEKKLNNVANKIDLNHPNAAEVFAADVTLEKDVSTLAEYIEKNHGSLHVVINSAGGSATSKIRDITVEEWDQIFALNLRSVFLVSKILGNLMTKSLDNEKYKKDRAIINVASLSGYKAGAQIPHYSASKAAVINFTRALANEFAAFGIRVNSVSPGFVETPLIEEGMKNQRFIESLKRNTALRRAGRPEEIANVISFMASPEASYMTGSDVLVDGGWLVT